MALYKRGKYWYYEFEFRGRRHRRSTRETSKVRARAVEAATLDELRNPVQQVEDITFKDLAGKYLKIHAATKRGETFYKYTVRVLKRHFGEVMLSEIGPAEVDAFMAERRTEVKTATANRSLAVLKHMFKLAMRWGHLVKNPAAGVMREREPRGRESFLTEDQASTLIRETPAWLRPLIVTALHTGARQGELLALTWGDVDLDRETLTFTRTKNGEPRVVRMSQTVKATIEDLPRGLPAARVFRNQSGSPIHRDGLTWSFRRAVRLAGLEGFRFHDLRHSAASFLVQAGVPLNTVREILGHRSLGMTLRYAHLAPDHQADAVAAMDALGQVDRSRSEAK